MSKASIPLSPLLTADSELHRGKSHESSPMLELYRSEEPTLAARLLMPGKRDANEDRLSAARKQISTFQQQWSKRK
ncbi:hypothetical protein F4824DRAFT_446225 [Ustulina deusta]|nr:hypothetical protein F4824DRAFT_446225 [Ustulina deusta]